MIMYTKFLQPLTLAHVPAARVSSAEACSRTVRKRSSDLEEIRAGMSKDSRAQLQAELKGLPASERNQLLVSAGITLDIPPEKGLALKANLAIPWNKLRTVRRYTAYSSYTNRFKLQ